MPTKLPSYRQRSSSDLAVVTLRDSVTGARRDYYLGVFNTPASREQYHRLIAQWEADKRRLPNTPALDAATTDGTTIEEIAAAYWEHAESYYTPSEASAIKTALRLLRQLFGNTSAAAFGPKSLRLVRDAMVRGDPDADPPRAPWCRKSINKQVHRIGAMFKWAAGQELLLVTVYQQLKTLEPLKRGRTPAHENEPVKPVPDALVDPIEPFVSRQVWTMIQLQRFTGARCGELFRLRRGDIRTGGADEVWTYTPLDHKTAHHGLSRTIYFGPQAKAALGSLMLRPDDAYLFSPGEAERERRVDLHAGRKTPLQFGNRPGSNVKEEPAVAPGDHYTAASYRRAIERGCDLAFPPPSHLVRQPRQPLAGLPGGLRGGGKHSGGGAVRDGSEAAGQAAAAKAVGAAREMSMKMVKQVQVEAVKGLLCPKCGCRHLAVVYTRPKAEHLMRVRACRHCGKRVVT